MNSVLQLCKPPRSIESRGLAPDAPDYAVQLGDRNGTGGNWVCFAKPKCRSWFGLIPAHHRGTPPEAKANFRQLQSAQQKIGFVPSFCLTRTQLPRTVRPAVERAATPRGLHKGSPKPDRCLFFRSSGPETNWPKCSRREPLLTSEPHLTCLPPLGILKLRGRGAVAISSRAGFPMRFGGLGERGRGCSAETGMESSVPSGWGVGLIPCSLSLVSQAGGALSGMKPRARSACTFLLFRIPPQVAD